MLNHFFWQISFVLYIISLVWFLAYLIYRCCQLIVQHSQTFIWLIVNKFKILHLDIPLAQVVRKMAMDNAIHRINHYPVDSVVCFVNNYPLHAIYPVDSVIQPLNNRGLKYNIFCISFNLHGHATHLLTTVMKYQQICVCLEANATLQTFQWWKWEGNCIIRVQ